MSDDPDKPWRLPNATRMTFDDMAARAQYEWQRAEDAEAEVKAMADRIEELEAKLAKVKASYRRNMMQAYPAYTSEQFDKDYEEMMGGKDD